MTEPSFQLTPLETAQALGAALPPLGVAGLLVTRAQLIQALRIYLPSLAEVRALEGSEAFLLIFGEETPPSVREGGDHA